MNATKRKARKKHECSLCKEPINEGVTYIHEYVTPWDHPDNDHFFEFKAHQDCNKKWRRIGPDVDGLLPETKGEWTELVKSYNEEVTQ